MAEKHGSLSINSENIFPIIKKWLYSDHDIFARELISNGCDAITKLKKLDVMGEYTLPDDYKAEVHVIVNPEEKTLKFIDTGLGMTADEVEEYITQIAFSGATEFLSKYKDKTTDDQIIGHFGLGFYSAFMVADEVQIDTLSYKEGAEPVHWECDGGTEYSMETGKRTEVGTEITLFLNEDCLEFANEYRAREVISKYCSFMPVNIYLAKENGEQEYETIDESELRDDDVVVEHIHEDAKTEEIEKEDGTIDHTALSAGSASVIISNAKDPEAAWDFLSWWTSTDTQVSYGQEIESILGTSARYNTANLEAVAQLPWSSSDYKAIYNQWQSARSLPEYPGSYILGRYLSFAFQAVVNQDADPGEELLDNVRLINEELTRKQKEFADNENKK